MINFYSSAVKDLKEKSLYRQLVESDVINAVTVQRGKKKFISFSSNDYLGLSQNSEVKKSAIAAIKKFGLGAGASRYITGNNSLYTKLEKEIARMKNCDEAIVFSSGYAAAIGVIPALVNEGDLIIADRLIHSSLIDGAKLSGARFTRFLHNDIAHCKKILEENRTKFRKCLIITETIFSMDGDVGKISELLELAKKFDCLFLSDAAHDLWIPKCHHSPLEGESKGFSPSVGGQNLKIAEEVKKNYHLQLGTLSKSVGTLGGYVAGDKILIEYLRNFAKSAIYSTALPPVILEASIASLKIISKKNLGKKALENAKYFCDLMNLPKPKSAIVVIIIGENKKTLEIAKKIADQGFLISAIRPPTVETGKARLRITFSSEHKKAQIKKLAGIVKFGIN